MASSGLSLLTVAVWGGGRRGRGWKDWGGEEEGGGGGNEGRVGLEGAGVGSAGIKGVDSSGREKV